MESIWIFPSQYLPSPAYSMNTISANFRTKIRFGSSKFRCFCASSLDLTNNHELVSGRSCPKRKMVDSFRVRVKVSEAQLKENWLASLSYPFSQMDGQRSINGEEPTSNVDSQWVIGIDPDLSGALALLKSENSVCSAQVFDSPHLQVLIGKRIRKRLDAKSIVQLLRNLDAPHDGILRHPIVLEFLGEGEALTVGNGDRGGEKELKYILSNQFRIHKMGNRMTAGSLHQHYFHLWVPS
ncbi:uncharacterized protein LOC122060963 isoform X3 [Macadamia integrifolia]|uniref:uncharacterized protein LOC122060963 isoform X3 n=1 Tax=Macadamia integrifolia TaxID=60698 RepID=UPI001C52FF91|nr:uncharacterized protein LOC122060963 isoform X3 [Macadamia integrifolia]